MNETPVAPTIAIFVSSDLCDFITHAVASREASVPLLVPSDVELQWIPPLFVCAMSVEVNGDTS